MRLKPNLATIVLAIVLFGCATKPNVARPGISEQEAEILAQYFYYTPRYAAPAYTRDQLAQLLRKSAYPSLDGEDAEAQMSSVAIALAAVGDDRFADVLSHEPDPIRQAVYRDVSPLWTRFGLYYSKTEALLRRFADES